MVHQHHHHHHNNEECYHSINDLIPTTTDNNNLKGASSAIAAINNTAIPRITIPPNQSISMSQEEIDLIQNVINISGLYVTKNPQIFQQPEEMIGKLTEAWNIIASKQNNNSVKGASICPNKNLKNLLNMFHL